MQSENQVTNRIPFQVWAILILLNIGLIFSVLNNQILNQADNQSSQTPQISPQITVIQTGTQISTKTTTATDDPVFNADSSSFFENENLYFFSINQSGIFHIYAFSPGNLKPTQLFDSTFEEIHPALNPDKTKLAYVARKNGYWDVYIYDFSTRIETRVTDSPEYEGHPTWSPDSQYLAFETFDGQNLDIIIQPLNNLNDPSIQLTEGMEVDHSPAWSPTGREIAFVSTKSGEPEIWVASLDSIENRFENISQQPDTSNTNPAWSSDGTTLFWTVEQDGYQLLQTYNRSQAEPIIQTFSEGDHATSVDQQIFFLQNDGNNVFLSARDISGVILLPATKLVGSVDGFSIMPPSELSRSLVQQLNQSENSRKGLLNVTASDLSPQGDLGGLIKLDDIEAPFPYFLNGVDSKFLSLRQITSNEIGWDFLASLSNAFVPITEPQAPENENNWSFTGRSFEFNPLTMYAGLAVVTREERSGQTFWRVFLKSRYQDGTQGRPLSGMPWQLDARYSNEPLSYENGGRYTQIPEGYWIDFTILAQSSGWERLPALPNWRTYFPAARFNQYIYSAGLDWYTAMNSIYPSEALRSPTPLPSITITPSLTPTIRYYRSPTSTEIPTETPVPTRRPTWTPSP